MSTKTGETRTPVTRKVYVFIPYSYAFGGPAVHRHKKKNDYVGRTPAGWWTIGPKVYPN